MLQLLKTSLLKKGDILKNLGLVLTEGKSEFAPVKKNVSITCYGYDLTFWLH